MRLNEIRVIDLAEKAYYEMHNMLQKAKLLENNNNYFLYSNFIDDEKVKLPVSVLGNLYYPMYLNASPVAEYIRGEYSNNGLKFTGTTTNGYLFSNNHGSTIKFPMDKYQGDGRIDLLIFDNISYQQQFLTALKLKFSHWYLNITQVNI